MSPPTKKKSKPPSTPKAVSDFAILPLRLPSPSHLPESSNSALHYLYLKPHTPSIPTESAERSLFVANVPIDASEANIRALFTKQLGGSRVERVEFDTAVPAVAGAKRYRAELVGKKGEGQVGQKRKRGIERDEQIVAEGVVEDEDSALPKVWRGSLRRSGGGAVVVFVDRASSKGAWKEVRTAVKEGREVRWEGVVEGDDLVLGIKRYTTHHNLTFPSKTHLQSTINAYLGQFTRAETARNRLRLTQRSVPDEDGFITVSRGGRSGPARLEDAEKKKAELEERRKKNGVKDDFYRFQTREKRKERENELRRKFEEDRRRVAEMRERRGGVKIQQ